MPSLIISSYDGVTKVAAIEPTPEMLAEAESFESMDEALQAFGEVLGEQTTDPAAGDGTDENTPEGPMNPDGPQMAQDVIPQDDEDMQSGYASAKRGI